MIWSISLDGTFKCHEIFSNFFSWIIFPQASVFWQKLLDIFASHGAPAVSKTLDGVKKMLSAVGDRVQIFKRYRRQSTAVAERLKFAEEYNFVWF